MGLINKLKNILFEEEEVEIPILEKKEKKIVPERETPSYKEIPRQEKTYNSNNYYNNLEPVIEKETKLEEEAKKSSPMPMREEQIVSDREMFRSDKTFNFPAFDEEEFESIKAPRPTNVIAHERKKVEKKNEYKRPEKKEEVRDTKFKPSPIISPVYGILDKNYTPEEITSRSPINKRLDVDSVRKKAFGEPEKEKIEKKEKEEVIIKDYQDYDDKILEEKLEKARTIDELLKDSSDDVISLREEKEITRESAPEIKEQTDLTEDILEEDAITSLDEITPKNDDAMEDDTLESDLFDLIDSMYENREDGE